MDFKHLPEVVQSKHSVVVAERKRVKAKILNNSCKKVTYERHTCSHPNWPHQKHRHPINSINYDFFWQKLATMLNVEY